MSATGALQPKQFFHGSPHEFKPGDELLPPSKTGATLNRGDSHPDHVYVTPHAFVAAQYTWAFDKNGKLAAPQGETKIPAGHVYEVEPRGQLRNDPNAPRHIKGLSKYTTKGAVVKRKLDPEEWR